MSDTQPVKTVFEAWAAVMSDVQAISKDSRNTQQGFNFRGIDAVMNVVGPVLRTHGVTVVPTAVSHGSERYESKRGGPMVNRTVEMGYTVYGPAGDSFGGIVFGEAADSGDKAMTKAESVALRTFLLQALMIPTDESDPDGETHERASSPASRPITSVAVPPDDNPDSREARATLKEVAAEQGWDLNAVANAFAKASGGKALKQSSGDEVTAFMNNLLAGTITL